MSQLKAIARDLMCPVVLSVALDSMPSTSSTKPHMSELLAMGSISEVDAVLLIHREEVHELASQQIDRAEIIVARNKSGATKSVWLGFDKTTARFYTLDRMIL